METFISKIQKEPGRCWRWLKTPNKETHHHNDRVGIKCKIIPRTDHHWSSVMKDYLAPVLKGDDYCGRIYSNQPSGWIRHDLNKSPDFLLCLTFDKNSARELEIIETDNCPSLLSDNLENIFIVQCYMLYVINKNKTILTSMTPGHFSRLSWVALWN